MNKTASLAVMSAALAFTAYIFFENLGDADGPGRGPSGARDSLMTQWLAAQAGSVRQPIDSRAVLTDEDGGQAALGDIVDGSYHIAMVVSKYQKQDLYESALKFLCESLSGCDTANVPQPLILLLDFSQGEIRNLRNRTDIEWPLYAVGGEAFDRKVWKADGRYPSLCMIDPECNISYPVALSEVMYPSAKSFVQYLHRQTQRYQVRHNDSIYAVNPVIDMGNVNIREIRRTALRLVNKSRRCMTVLSVEPHCDCTTVGDYDKTVMPGDTLVVNVEFQSTNAGEFEREVEVRMDGLDEPVLYTLLGSVGKNRILY